MRESNQSFVSNFPELPVASGAAGVSCQVRTMPGAPGAKVIATKMSG
jgi:hypothetical protein